MRTPHPRLLWIPAALALLFLALPLAALISRVEWSTLWRDTTSEAALNALVLSLVTAGTATVVCIVIGVPLAIFIARAPRGIAAAARILVAIPLVLPPMVGGVALLFLFGGSSVLGGWLSDAFDVALPFTTVAVVQAQIFVALPFLVLAVEGSVRTAGTEYERTASALGARRWTVLWRITLPLAGNGLLAGVILCFARAIGEFGATALFAGNAPGVTQTMPLAIYTAFNGSGVEQGAAVALSVMLIVAVLLVLLVTRAWRPGSLT
ncbi:molybdate ABC transporter permease [Microbacterium faecale]|uniref:Molybdate ABC transporter permease n=2 Tax=Microbacterium faecale TaxID=1804630 RepID=A0A916YDR3_9MICO|nr:molybdate ABC transporter permease [Microbacterium faecale]